VQVQQPLSNREERLRSARVYPRAVAAAVHVTRWGAGEPAVLVHGSFGWGEEVWREQKPLAREYELLLVDRRGFGRSPADGRVDFERDAADVAALLPAGGAHLVGHSYGGIVALLAAAQPGAAVRSLTVVEPPALALVRGNESVEEFVAAVDAAIAAAADPSDYRVRFLRAFGFHAQPLRLKGRHLEAARASLGECPPWEAAIPLDTLARAPFPKHGASARERAVQTRRL
jgi:pimeloyl-ACP methyl ester carboxylesterase